jgi:hypothetical protein
MGIGGEALRCAERTERKPGEQFQRLTTMHGGLQESMVESFSHESFGLKSQAVQN